MPGQGKSQGREKGSGPGRGRGGGMNKSGFCACPKCGPKVKHELKNAPALEPRIVFSRVFLYFRFSHLTSLTV
jgi:hypothetical protein